MPKFPVLKRRVIMTDWNQTCAKVPKRFEILGSLSPRSGTLMDLGPCTSFLPWDSGNPGPQNCVMPQDPGNPGPQYFDMQWDPENPGPQNFDSRKTLETQDLKIWMSLVRLPPVVYLNLMHSVRRIANNAIGRQDKNKPHKPIILRPKIRF